LRSAQANNSPDPISKITREKWIGSVAQAVQYLLFKLEALSSNPSPTKKSLKVFLFLKIRKIFRCCKTY
jgi:hypothetical protein